MPKTIQELDKHIAKNIQGVFSEADMEVLKTEIEKLKPGDVYLEVGVDEGRSFTTAYEYAPKGVFIIGIDIHNVDPHPASVGRGKWMESEGMVGIGKRGFFIHGDADELASLFSDIAYQFYSGERNEFINLMFIDGHHDYESVKKNTLAWKDFVIPGGVILFHDYDHPDTKKWLDYYYGKDKQVLHDKIVKVIR